MYVKVVFFWFDLANNITVSWLMATIMYIIAGKF